MLFRETIAHFDLLDRVMLTKGTDHGPINSTPPELAILKGYASLGFEYLGLGRHDHWPLLKAMAGTGVRIPNTPYRFRVALQAHISIELADGSEEATLPEYWIEAVTVTINTGSTRSNGWMYNHFMYTWIGNRRPFPGINTKLPQDYTQTATGLKYEALQSPYN